MKRMLACVLAAVSLAGAGAAQAAGDVAAGEAQFKKCAACHSVGEGAKNKIGPVLNDVVGRQPGTFEGFAYSPAMVKFGEEHEAWTPELLDAFIADPRGTVPTTKMAFAGIKDDDDREDLIAYLVSISPDYVPAQ